MNLIFTLVSLVICDQISASPKFFDYLDGIESLEANFLQEITDQDGVVLETSQGSLKIKKPNKYKWVYFSPIEQASGHGAQWGPIIPNHTMIGRQSNQKFLGLHISILERTRQQQQQQRTDRRQINPF